MRQADERQEFELYAPGSTTWRSPSRPSEDVDAAHEAAAREGAEVLHAPGLAAVPPGYYATFFLDPDGFRLEVAASRDARL